MRKQINNLMKKVISILACLICVSFCYTEAKVKYQIKTGLGVSEYNGDSQAGNRFSGKIGLGVDIPLKGNWSIEPGLYYSGKGTQFKGLSVVETSSGSPDVVLSKYRNSLHYIEVPVHAVFGLKFGDYTKLSVKAGPYFALGIKGTANIKTPMYNDYNANYPDDLFSDGCTYGGNSYLSFSDDDAIYTKPFRRFDVGASIGVDLLFRHVILGFNTEIGVVKLSDDFLKGSPRNMASYVMVGYQF